MSRQPEPAILIHYSPDDSAWLATTVTGVPALFVGPSTADGRTPTDALNALLEKCLLGLVTEADAKPITFGEAPR